MRTLVIYPGRFHPFHPGHFASYEFLTRKFGPENVFIATSDKQAPMTSPFSFGDKQHMMAKLGVPASRVVRVKNPYQAQEITKDFPAEDTQLIFALSEKDAERFSFAPKRDGSPSYMQPYPENGRGLRPMSQHGYVLLTPTVDFRLPGTAARSATEIRNLYMQGSDQQRDQIIAALYGDADKNLRKIWDQRLVPAEQVQEFVNEQRRQPTARGRAIMERILKLERQALHEDSESFILVLNGEPAGRFDDLSELRRAAAHIQERYPEVKISVSREFCSVRPLDLKENLRRFFEKQLLAELQHQDYLEEKWSAKYKRSINCDNPRGFSQRAHCQGRKKSSKK